MDVDGFVIWGTGERGKIITGFLEAEQIIAYIDSDEKKQGIPFFNRPVISLEEYKEQFRDYFIIVTPDDDAAIIEELKDSKIDHYFRMSHLPSEMQGYGDADFMNQMELPLTRDGNNVIYGMTLYAYLLYNKIREMNYENTFLFAEPGDKFACLMKNALHCSFISQIDREKDTIILAIPEQRAAMESCGGRTVDLFDISDRLPKYFNAGLMNYHNIHQGKRCFIVATGPSLREEDLIKLARHQEICFGVNRVFHIDERLWKPQYYIFLDRMGMKRYGDKIRAYDVEEKFVGDSLEDSYWKKTDCKGNIHILHSVTGHSFDVPPKFSEHLERKVYSYGTVTYSAIQLAVYMGFSTIYLLGVDCNYDKNSKKNYFFEEQKEDGRNHFENRMLTAYRCAQKYAQAHNIQIYNASRGGMLEEFERVHFDDIII